MAVTLATVTGAFPDGAAAFPQFTPSQPVNLDGGPELLGAQPVKAVISGGHLLAADGTSPLQLPVTGQGTTVGATGFWYWTVSGLPGVPSFGFFLTADSDLSDLINSTAPGSSDAVTSVNTQTGAVVLGAADVGAVAKAGDAMAGYFAPKVVALADGATITPDAAAGNDFYVTLAGNRTMAVPSNPHDSQKITFEIIQDGTGNRTLTWTGGAGGYSFGGGSAPVLSTAAAAADQVAFRYSARKSQWLCLGSDGGF